MPWLSCERTARALEGLEGRLAAAAGDEHAALANVATALIRRGGKRIRPALVFLAATFGERGDGVQPDLAACVELIHTAALYHDDVVDRAPARRGAPSAQSQAGVAEAMVAGAYLSARAIEIAALAGDAANRMVSTALLELCKGELQELEHAYDLELSPRLHLEILNRKTGSMFALPCRLGATVAGAHPATVAALTAYGRELGLAFQIADDALDFVGDERTVGKSVHSDLPDGRYSLPVLLTLRSGGPHADELRAILLRDVLSPEEVNRAQELVHDSNSFAVALGVARERAEAARRAAADLPEGPARASLRALALYAVMRSS